MRPWNILIACEESQAVCIEMRKRGHNAFSNDIQECSGGHPEWHLKMDAKQAIIYQQWDLIILHPPCTKVAVSGNGTYANTKERIEAANWNADLFICAGDWCEKVAMEQPVTVLRSIRPDLPKPQYVDIWWFGDKECKKTAWYLRGLPELQMTDNVGPPPKGRERNEWMKTWMMTPSDDRGKLRSKLNPKMAHALAEQWTPTLNPLLP